MFERWTEALKLWIVDEGLVKVVLGWTELELLVIANNKGDVGLEEEAVENIVEEKKAFLSAETRVDWVGITFGELMDSFVVNKVEVADGVLADCVACLDDGDDVTTANM